MSNSKFAVFDIDGTVIRWQLYHAIVGQLARGKNLRPGAAEEIREARLTWKIRSHQESFRQYERMLVHMFQEALPRISVEELEAASQTVFDEHKDQVYIFSRDLIRTLKADGYTLLAISGSPHRVVQKLADYYGFDDFAGTVYRETDGLLGEEIATPVHNKAAALQALVAKHQLNYEGSIAVGDSKSDAAMLELVEQPIAFNPEQSLLDIAQPKGWKIVVERKNVVYQLESRDGQYLLA